MGVREARRAIPPSTGRCDGAAVPSQGGGAARNARNHCIAGRSVLANESALPGCLRARSLGRQGQRGRGKRKEVWGREAPGAGASPSVSPGYEIEFLAQLLSAKVLPDSAGRPTLARARSCVAALRPPGKPASGKPAGTAIPWPREAPRGATRVMRNRGLRSQVRRSRPSGETAGGARGS